MLGGIRKVVAQCTGAVAEPAVPATGGECMSLVDVTRCTVAIFAHNEERTLYSRNKQFDGYLIRPRGTDSRYDSCWKYWSGYAEDSGT